MRGQDQMDIQTNQARRAKQDQMDIQYLQTRRSRQISQRQARQNIKHLQQQIEKRINTNFTSQKEIKVGELLEELGKTGSPQYKQYETAAYNWKIKYVGDKIKKIIAVPWTEQKGRQVDALMNQIQPLMTLDAYQRDLEILRLWKLKYEIREIINSDFTSQNDVKVKGLLDELRTIHSNATQYQQYKTAAFEWKSEYLRDKIRKIIADPWTAQKGQNALKLLNQLQPLNQNIYQEDLKVIRSWEARHYEDEIKKIMENRFNTSRYSRVTEILDILESQYPERYENVLKWTYRWRGYYYIEEIKKIIFDRYTFDREQEALRFLEKLGSVVDRKEYEFWRDRIFEWRWRKQ